MEIESPVRKLNKKHPIPPLSIVRVADVARSPWKKQIGRRFRIGYYSPQDGLDCIWLVNEKGVYEQTLDHDYLRRYFVIEHLSTERSRYGRNRPILKPLA
jgi:hypothetical protein